MDTKQNQQAILVVDDEAIILMHMLSLLRQKYSDRFRYEKASSAEKGLLAIDALYAQGYRVIAIISDWIMPGIDGVDFLRQVHAKYPDIQAIMVSGKVTPNPENPLPQSAGLIGFLAKPVIPHQLYELIDQIINQEETRII